MKAGASVPCVLGWECARGPFAAMFGKKRNRIWKFRVSKCDFFLGCRGDAGVALFLLFPSEREAERALEFVARHETVVEREGRFGSVCPKSSLINLALNVLFGFIPHLLKNLLSK